MSQFEIAEGDRTLRMLVDRARAGEDVVLIDAGEMVARIVLHESGTDGSRPRILGRLEGQFSVPEDFDAPLPDEVLDRFYNGPIFPDETPLSNSGPADRSTLRR